MKETDCLKVDKDLLSRLLIVARTWKVDLGEILTHCLSQFPSSLRSSNGSLQWTNKAALFHYLHTKFPDMKIIKIPQNTALNLYCMAITQQQADHLPAMFGDLSIFIFRSIIKLASFYRSSRVDFVCDKYNPLIIEYSERRRHSISPGYLLHALNEWGLENSHPVLEIPHIWQKQRISCSIYSDALKEIDTRRIPWKNCVCFIEPRVFHVVSSKWQKWSDHKLCKN